MKNWTPISLAIGAFIGQLNAGEAPAQTGHTASSPATVSPAPSDYVSPWLSEVTKLVEANVETGVVMEFINGSGTFGLSSSQIISLNERGFPSEIVAAMIQHDAEYASGLRVNPPTPAGRVIVLRSVREPKPSPIGSDGVQSATPPICGSIVNPSPAPDLWLEYYFPDPELVIPKTPAPAAKPVREPYPVRLTNTILVHRGYARMANVHTLDPFPADTIQP